MLILALTAGRGKKRWNDGPEPLCGDRSAERASSYQSVIGRQGKALRLQMLVSMLVYLLAVMLGADAHAQDKQPEYLLGSGDVIRVLVFQNPDLTMEARVTENGLISYPLLGTMKLGGMTIPAAEQAIAAALKAGGFVQNPQVNVILLQNRGNQVSVLGMVNRPGRFPLETFNIRVSEMIATAGGISPVGADVAVLTGARDGKLFHKEIDIAGLFLDNKLADDLVVAAGDVIYVHRQPVYYIYGEVQRPGPYRVERNMTVQQALAQGGGLTLRGTERSLRVNRRGHDGKVEALTPNLNDYVRPDDVLYVRESLF
jgi:polysaccharide export outer membrane protein